MYSLVNNLFHCIVKSNSLKIFQIISLNEECMAVEFLKFTQLKCWVDIKLGILTVTPDSRNKYFQH
jgi:hypothetical protein